MTRPTASVRRSIRRLSRRGVLRTGGLAAGVSAVLASLPSGDVSAQAPEGEQPTPQKQEEQVVGAIQYIHPDKTLNYGHLPGFEDASVTAALYGLDAESYRSIKARFEANARGAAQELLADPTDAGLVDRIPIRPSATVLGIGESDMDDLQSWFEILRHLLELRRPQDQIRLINMGISGQTTTQGLGRPAPPEMLNPDGVHPSLAGQTVIARAFVEHLAAS
jgi:hypothetical protein